MKRDSLKMKKYMIVSGVVVLVFGFTIAFALFSTQLTISGQLIKEEGTWKIGFTDVAAPVLTGSAESYRNDVTTDGTSLNVYASLTEPGDSVTYTFNVANEGNINAKVLSYNMGTLNSYDTDLTDYNIEGTLTYSDGTAIREDDTLDKGEKKGLKLTLKYNGEQSLTENDVYFSFNVKINYIQN